MSAMNTMGHILLVDDDTNITDMLTSNLTSAGFGVDVVPVAKDVNTDNLNAYRLLIIDALRQKYNGLELITDIKSKKQYTNLPIIVCATPESEDIVIEAFDKGAEDFINKPFSLLELMARTKAILRRHPVKAPTPNDRPSISLPEINLSIDLENQKVTVEDVVVPLTKTEYAILIFLIQNRNAFYTRADICKEVWKEDASDNVRIVDTNISRLRKKLGESGKYIINRYGMGYAFVDKLAQ